jgi:hypothetical protein
LTDKEWDALDEFRFSTTDVKQFRNATAILMAVELPQKLGLAAVPLVEREPLEVDAILLGPGSRQRSPSADQLSGRNNSPSSRQ